MAKKKEIEAPQAVETINVTPTAYASAAEVTDFFCEEHTGNSENTITESKFNGGIEALSGDTPASYSDVKKLIELRHLYIIKEYIDNGDAANGSGNASVVSENGAVGLRYYNKKLQYKDGLAWKDIETAGACDSSVSDTDGIHDLRILDEKLQYKKNGVWTDVIVVSSGGSVSEDLAGASIADDNDVKKLFEL